MPLRPLAPQAVLRRHASHDRLPGVRVGRADRDLDEIAELRSELVIGTVVIGDRRQRQPRPDSDIHSPIPVSLSRRPGGLHRLSRSLRDAAAPAAADARLQRHALRGQPDGDGVDDRASRSRRRSSAGSPIVVGRKRVIVGSAFVADGGDGAGGDLDEPARSSSAGVSSQGLVDAGRVRDHDRLRARRVADVACRPRDGGVRQRHGDRRLLRPRARRARGVRRTSWHSGVRRRSPCANLVAAVLPGVPGCRARHARPSAPLARSRAVDRPADLRIRS